MGGKPEALGIIQQAAMATVVSVEVSLSLPGHHQSRHDGEQATVGEEGAWSLSSAASSQHRQASYNSILCLFALLFRSSFEAVASVTNIILCNSSTEASITLWLHVLLNDWQPARQQARELSRRLKVASLFFSGAHNQRETIFSLTANETRARLTKTSYCQQLAVLHTRI